MSNNISGNVKIEITGSHPAVLSASAPNTGSFVWNIPANQALGSDYKIKISEAADGDPFDESDNTFSVIEPFVLPNLIITEIMYNSPGNDEEWIEIYNNGTSTVDMSGFYILDDDPAHIADPIVLPAGASIAPAARYTVENATDGNFPFVPNFNGSGKFSFGNTTDQVKLYHKFGQLIDSVKYMDTAPWPTGPDGGGSTLTFCDPSLDNSLGSNWAASTESFVTLQGTTILATPGEGCYVSSDGVMITEIMYNPIDAGNDTIEFIELYNKGSVAVNLKDWHFSSGVGFTFPDVTLAPGAYSIVARDAVAMQNTFNISCYQWTDGLLDDAGEPIVLKDAIGQTVDSVYYHSTSPWPTTPNNGGPSLTFCNTSLDNSLGENWSASTNQVAVNGLGQAIYASPLATCSSGANLVITEIMYNPPETGTDTLEFIEIYNAGNTLNLEGYSFSTGVEFVFPNVELAAGNYLLVAGNASAIQNTFGKAALQWTSGSLSNSGEALTIKDNFGSIVDEVTYTDTDPWSPLADGYGPSLTLCDPQSNNALALNWKASSELAAVNSLGDSIFATPLGGCVNPPTVANFEGTPTAIVEGQSVQFHDLSTNNPISWAWSFEGGTPATSTDQNPLVQYNTYGIYAVSLTATNAYGSSSLTKPAYISVGTDGINVMPFIVKAYPNPTTGEITITNPESKNLRVDVYTTFGTLVLSDISENALVKMDLTHQVKGIYIIRVTELDTQHFGYTKVVVK
jgi:PKD repeat protein